MENEKSIQMPVKIKHCYSNRCKVALHCNRRRGLCEGVLAPDTGPFLPTPAMANGPGVMSFLVRQLKKKRVIMAFIITELVDMIES